MGKIIKQKFKTQICLLNEFTYTCQPPEFDVLSSKTFSDPWYIYRKNKQKFIDEFPTSKVYLEKSFEDIF